MIEYQGHNIKNVTLENLYKLLKDVAGANLLVSTTTIGDIFEVDLVETSYPLLHIGTSSDTLQMIGDILSAIRYTNATEYTDFLHVVRIDDNISCEPFTERFDNEVSGWTATINIEVDFDASACSGQIPT